MRVAPREDGSTDEVRTASPWRTVLVAGLVVALGARAGFTTMVLIVALLLIIFMHELGHYLTARWAGMKVTEFFIGFGPRIWSFTRGETTYGLKAIPAGAYVRIIGMSNLEEVDANDESRTYRAKPFWRRLSVAVAGSTMHFIMAFLLVLVVFAGFGRPRPDQWRIGSIVKASAAFDVGLHLGDRVVAVDGKPLRSFDDVSKYLRKQPGRTVALDVVNGDAQRTVEATLATVNPNTREKVGFLGIGPTFPLVRESPPRAIVSSVNEMGMLAKASVIGLGHIVSPKGVSQYVDHLIKPNDGKTGAAAVENRPTSVVGIVEIGSQVAHDGWVNVLYLLFGVNMFIGIFNLMPTLPFDGGHVAIATYEKIRSMITGRDYRADVTKLLPLTYAVVVMLGLLFVTSLYLDIAHPVSVR